MKIFLSAFCFRYLLWVFLVLAYRGNNTAIGSNPSTMGGDTMEYYSASQNLEIDPIRGYQFHYTKWYERNTVYVFFLWVFRTPYALFIQMLISSIGVLLMFKMNWKAGIFWNFWEAGYSILYNKEAIMFALIIFIIYKFRIKHEPAIS